MPNRLAGETSPYLLQHAHNPVDWYPWGPEALAKAKDEDKPIFLSIGYAACHWCHVMERESFEDAATAADLNRDFVAIKVDREERPDLDQVYMGAVQAMTGQGGWPMSVFLTPDGRPFFGGTYFPPEPHHGLPSFRQVLAGAARAWREDRLQVVAAGARLADALAEQNRLTTTGSMPDAATLDAAVAELGRRFDSLNGSWGGAPKFPQPMTLDFLLARIAAGDGGPVAMVRQTLDRMADGGIRDQLGGGFHRYATDPIWLVPHFEQMLYDNAQLARTYVRAWVVLRARGAPGADRYRDVGIAVLDAILRDFRRPDGTFAASRDADTDGVEGATFTWSAEEIRAVLGEDAPEFEAVYGVRPGGNWEGRTILSRIVPAVDERGEITDPARESRLKDARRRLLAARSERAQPGRDDKALAAWNGLAIAALAEAARFLDLVDGAGGAPSGDDRSGDDGPGGADRAATYRSAATDAASTLLAGLRGPDGRLGRSWKDGRATGQAVLEDYADLADGLLALYEATFDERWFTAGRELGATILERFADPAGGFFDTADDHEALVVRPKDPQDNATPSGGSMATRVLLRLAALTGEARFRGASERALASVSAYLARYPTGFGSWLVAATLAVDGIDELAIVGPPSARATRALLAAGSADGRANLVVAASADPAASAIPLLADRAMIDGVPTAYLCRDFACRLPVTDAATLRAQLDASPP
ncbi:MAG TPA: thioredoxin domain-containing protein [Candidatus Limnocylindrales bacterium]|nr:thioredoxin domain-containing protein [Candidatus Limnocylindrales bacterium]